MIFKNLAHAINARKKALAKSTERLESFDIFVNREMQRLAMARRRLEKQVLGHKDMLLWLTKEQKKERKVMGFE